MEETSQHSITLHPRDKGWAWMIVIGSFVVNGILIGYIRSFGILFVAIQNQYGYSSGLLSVVVGVQNVAFCLVTVFVMNVFIKKNSVRFSCIIGILLQTLAVSICDIFQNSIFLIVCLGLLFGIGQGFLYFPSQYIVPIYFHKRQSMAVVIASCGSGLGGVTFPIVTRALLDFYGLQGTLLMIAGILLNQLMFVMLYTPPSEYGYLEHTKSSSCSGNVVVQLQQQKPVISDANARGVDSKLEGSPQNDSEYEFSQHSKIDFESHVVQQERLLISDAHDVDAVLEVSFHTDSLISETGSETQWNGAKNQHDCESIFYSKCGLYGHSSFLENDNRRLEEESEKPEANRQNSHNLKRSFLCVENIPVKFDCHLPIPWVFHSTMFWAMLGYFFGCPVGSGCAALFLPPLAIERGLSNNAGAYFLTISAVMDIIGRLISGLILQMHWMTPSGLAFVPQAIGCVLYSLTYVIQGYTGMLILSIVFGLISSFFFATRYLLIIEVLGMSHLASATGYYGLATGIAMGISFPIGGFLHDATGTYSASFVYLAACFLLGILSLVVVKMLKRRQSKEKRTEVK